MKEVKSFYDLVGDNYSVKIRVLERGEKYIGCYGMMICGSSLFTNPDYEDRKEFNTIQEAVKDAKMNAKSTIRMHMKFRDLSPELVEYAGKTPIVSHQIATNKQVELF